jgi:hypothetical protein
MTAISLVDIHTSNLGIFPRSMSESTPPVANTVQPNVNLPDDDQSGDKRTPVNDVGSAAPKRVKTADADTIDTKTTDGDALGHKTVLRVPTEDGVVKRAIWTPAKKLKSDKNRAFYATPNYDYPEIMEDYGFNRWFERLGLPAGAEESGTITMVSVTADVRRDDPSINVVIDNPMDAPRKVVWTKNDT